MTYDEDQKQIHEEEEVVSPDAVDELLDESEEEEDEDSIKDEVDQEEKLWE